MSDESNEKEFLQDNNAENQHSDYKPADRKDGIVKHQLTGMYQNWFLALLSWRNSFSLDSSLMVFSFSLRLLLMCRQKYENLLVVPS